MRAYLVTGNPGSGKSTLAAELSRRGLAAVDADELAFWEDSAGMPAVRPADSGDDWLLVHRWVWSGSRIQQAIADLGSRQDGCVGVRHSPQPSRDAGHVPQGVPAGHRRADVGSTACRGVPGPARPAAVRQQIRDGRPVFQAQMLARGAIPVDATVLPSDFADRLLAHLDLAARS